MKYSKPKVNASGGKSVGILNATTNTSLYLSTPLMLTWGVNTYTDDRTGRSTYDMALQFPSQEYFTKETREFLDNMKQLEEKINIESIRIEDKSFLHKNHAGNKEGKFHLKIHLKSIELKKMNRLESNKKIYKILDEELKMSIHSIQILIS